MQTVQPKTWYDIDPIEVITPGGSRVVSKLYCNGIEQTLNMVFKSPAGEEYIVECTLDHAFMTAEGEWIPAECIEPHHVFHGGYKLSYYELNEKPSMTFDISVPEENCYILDCGIVSHNTGLLMGGISEGINPDPAMTFTQLTSAGEVDRINPSLLKLMKSKGVYNKRNIAEISDKKGSVQHVDWLTDEEKEVFKTAFEINQKSIIRLASARGRYIDQWQSLNLFFAADEDPRWISEVHQEAFEDPNILGLYYVYSMALAQGSKDDSINRTECVACS